MGLRIFHIILFLALAGFIVAGSVAGMVVRKGEKYYIQDQHGELWDVSQAKSIGFNPEGFQFGIGRYAFTPLDDSDLSDDASSVFRNPRVIGITDGTAARAYSIPKLRYHEIANSQIGENSVAAAY